MNDTSYVEVLVARKPSALLMVLKYVLFLLAACAFLLSMTGYIAALILAIGFAAGAYFVTLNASIEYEYQYCEREITVDKILNKSKRKRVTIRVV